MPEDSVPQRQRGRRPQGSLPSDVPLDERNRRRCLRLVETGGQFSRGVQALTSRGIDQSSPAAYAAMLEKHPQVAPPQAPSSIAPQSVSFETQQVVKAVFASFLVENQFLMDHIEKPLPPKSQALHQNTYCKSSV